MDDQHGTVDALERLARLRDSGHLTPEEFEAQKTLLLPKKATSERRPEVAPAANGSGARLFSAAIAVAAVALITAMNWPHDSANSPANWQPPEGFTRITTDEGKPIAYRWMDGKEYSCHSRYCYGMEFVAPQACDNELYVQLALLDKAGTLVTWTNGMVPDVAPNRKSQITFSFYEPRVKSPDIREVKCL